MTKQSPRTTAAGIIKWYCGDSFDIDLELTLTKDGEEFNLKTGDKIVVSFYKQFINLPPIQTYVFTYTAEELLAANLTDVVRLNFTPEISAKFEVGQYKYCIAYIDGDTGYQTTIAANRLAEVELCH